MATKKLCNVAWLGCWASTTTCGKTFSNCNDKVGSYYRMARDFVTNLICGEQSRHDALIISKELNTRCAKWKRQTHPKRMKPVPATKDKVAVSLRPRNFKESEAVWTSFTKVGSRAFSRCWSITFSLDSRLDIFERIGGRNEWFNFDDTLYTLLGRNEK